MIIIVIFAPVLIALAMFVTVLNIINVIRYFAGHDLDYYFLKFTDLYSIIGGAILTYVYYHFIEFPSYREPLSFGGFHEPLYTDNIITVITLIVLSLVGYLVLKHYKKQMPPLFLALMICFVYIGIGFSIVFIIQVSKNIMNLYATLLALFPLNYILLSLIILRKTFLQETQGKKYSNKQLSILHRFIININQSPYYAFLLVLPVLGGIIIILMLYGQEPNSIITTFTKTSDWTFSKEISPPPIDGHYLCTVAAQGHPSLVKPIRYGVRHGHKIIVNRQLSIANAFEELIAEKLPRTHRLIRDIYDEYGYPLSKHISNPWSADVIYVIMKPFEWMFLTVLYLFDAYPEKRIEGQYSGKIKF